MACAAVWKTAMYCDAVMLLCYNTGAKVYAWVEAHRVRQKRSATNVLMHSSLAVAGTCPDQPWTLEFCASITHTKQDTLVTCM